MRSLPLAFVLLASPALANDKAVCLDAASKGQTLRDAHHLIEAREQLRLCTREQCPQAIKSDCTAWLDAVERSLPTVVVIVKDAAGSPVVDAKVTIDGVTISEKLDGHAIPIDPGLHKFHVELASAAIDQTTLVAEGAKDQSIVLTAQTTHAEIARDVPASSSPLRTVGWIVGGVGVAGIAVGAIFGLVASSDKGNANCDASNACDAGPLADAHTAATISDVGFIAGGVLVATGVALVLFAPHAVKIAPSVGSSGNGFVLRGVF